VQKADGRVSVKTNEYSTEVAMQNHTICERVAEEIRAEEEIRTCMRARQVQVSRRVQQRNLLLQVCHLETERHTV